MAKIYVPRASYAQSEKEEERGRKIAPLRAKEVAQIFLESSVLKQENIAGRRERLSVSSFPSAPSFFPLKTE